jgi:hypothetical protein
VNGILSPPNQLSRVECGNYYAQKPMLRGAVNRFSLGKKELIGGCGWTRTTDPGIMSAVL